MLDYLKSLPRKLVVGVIIAATVVFVVLQLMAKGTALKAKELNLGAIIRDALDKFKLKSNSDKIKDLDKKPNKEDLEKDPSKVEDFYKDRK
jgi:uncharacterized membrane protein YgaE (UPF0421/DUF939 family)